MRSPKPPKAPKPTKQIKIGPALKQLLKPKPPAHMKGGQHGAKPVKPGLPPGALPPARAGLPAPNTTADL